MNGKSPLHYAAVLEDSTCLGILLGIRAEVNGVTKEGYTALHYAVNNPENVRILLDFNANPNKCSFVLMDTPLHMAAAVGSLNVVTQLVKAGSKIDAQNQSEQTALIISILNRNTHIAKYLISQNAKLNIQDNCGISALGYGVYKNNTELCELLVEKGARITRSREWLHAAIQNQNVEIARLLLRNNEDVEKASYIGTTTPFYEAITIGQPEMIKLLIEHGGGKKYRLSMQQLVIDCRDRHHFEMVIRIISRNHLSLKPVIMNDLILCCSYARFDFAEVLVREGFRIWEFNNIPELLTSARDYNLIRLFVSAGLKVQKLHLTTSVRSNQQSQTLEYLERIATNPRPLRDLSRLAIRKSILEVNLSNKFDLEKTIFSYLVQFLHLPLELKNYIELKEIPRAVSSEPVSFG